MFSKSDEKATTTETETMKGDLPIKADDMSTFSKEEELPPPPYLEQPPTQTLDIKYKDWKCIRGLVNDPSTGQTLYNIELPSLTRIHCNLNTADDKEQIATSNPYTLKKALCVRYKGQDLQMRYNSIWKLSHNYISPAFNNRKLEWKCYSSWFKKCEMHYVLRNEEGVPLARWTVTGPKYKPFKDLGRLELFGDISQNRDALEEILITGLTSIFIEILTRSNATYGTSAIGTMIAVASGSKKSKSPTRVE